MRIYYKSTETGFLNRACLDCGEEINRGGRWCMKCVGKHTSERQRGKDNPMYKHGKCCGAKRSLKVIGGWVYNRTKKRTKRTSCIDCGGPLKSYGAKRCLPCSQAVPKKTVGKNNGKWKGGIMFAPYPIGWNKYLKEAIRKRDNYKCQDCGVPQMECVEKLHVHHIDYNKNNLDISNLICLCRRCHTKLRRQPAWAEPKYKELVLSRRVNT